MGGNARAARTAGRTAAVRSSGLPAAAPALAARGLPEPAAASGGAGPLRGAEAFGHRFDRLTPAPPVLPAAAGRGGVLQLAKGKYDPATGRITGGRPKWPRGFASVAAGQTRHHKTPWAKLKGTLNDALAIRKPNRQKRRLRHLAALADREGLITDKFLRRVRKKSTKPEFVRDVNSLAQGLFAIPGNIFVGPTARADDGGDQHDSHIDESGYESDRSRRVFRPLSRGIDEGLTNDKLAPLVRRFQRIRARGQNTVAPFNAREWDALPGGQFQKKPRRKRVKPPRVASRTVDPATGRTHIIFA